MALYLSYSTVKVSGCHVYVGIPTLSYSTVMSVLVICKNIQHFWHGIEVNIAFIFSSCYIGPLNTLELIALVTVL